MKITSVEVFHVKPRWLIVEVRTDKGVTGYGEPVVEGQSRVVAAMVDQLSEYLVGKDPRRIQQHWQHMYRSAFYRGGPVLVSAISGLEQAMYDISGKALNCSVADLLGGRVRDRIRMYPHVGGGSDSLEELVSTAIAAKAAGFTMVKTALPGPVEIIDTKRYVDEQARRFSSLREAVGPEVDIAIDFHGRVGPAMAVSLIEAIAPYRPAFVEEPCLPERPSVLGEIRRRTSVPIASGERIFTKFGFAELLRERAVDVVQPDLCHAGGIFETRLIAGMAEADYVSVAPHNPLGPVSLASCLQLGAVIPNLLVQEHPGMGDGRDLGHGLLTTPFQIENGFIRVSNNPGLGIEVDEDALRNQEFDGKWDSPYYAHRDGSFAEW